MITELVKPNLARFQSGTIGVHHGIPFADYLQMRLMSQSVLKQGRDSMRHLLYAVEEIIVPSDDMVLGSALHTAFLEPDKFEARVIQWTGASRRGKEWEAFKAEHAGKCILTPGYYENLTGMIASLQSHPQVKSWLSKIEDVEVSAIGMIQGVKFKGRCDALTADPLWDLKKVRATDEQTINRTIEDFGYAIQAAIYREIFGRDRFCLGFVEGTPPHDVRVVELSPSWLKIGKSEMTTLIQRYKHCCKEKYWPFRSEQIEQLEPPEWKLKEVGGGSEITIGGEAAFAE